MGPLLSEKHDKKKPSAFSNTVFWKDTFKLQTHVFSQNNLVRKFYFNILKQ